MIPHVETPAMGVEGRQECAEIKPVACVSDDCKIPVAYEEVILTEEAEELLEKERKAAAERPASKLRRMAVDASAITRS